MSSASPMRPADPTSGVPVVLQWMGVRPAERSLFAWGAVCLLLLGAATFALLNAGETLFLKRVGVEWIPLALLASSGLLVLTTAGIGAIARHDPQRWMPRVLVLLALTPLPFGFLMESGHPLVFGALVLIGRQVLGVAALIFWVAMGTLVSPRRAKQLFAPLAAGATLGGVAGSFGSEPLARLVGLEGLLLLCSAGLMGGAFAGARLVRTGTRRLETALARPAVQRADARVRFTRLVRSNRLFRLLAVALFCGGALNPVLYFQFTSVLDAVTVGPDAEQQLLGLYSQFRGWVNVALLGSQLWLCGALYRNIGLPLSLALWPMSYVLGFGWLGVDFALVAALASFGAARVSEEGVADSAQRVLYNLFPDGTRPQVSSLLEGPVYRLGGALGNGSVLAALALSGAAWIGWAGGAIAVLWLASALVLWRAYPALLLQASAEHGLAGADVDRASLLDGATLRSLATSLTASDPRACRAALDLLAAGEPERVACLIAEALEEAPEANQPLLVQALRQLVERATPEVARSDGAVQSLARTLRARALPAELRMDVLQVYADLTTGEGVAPELARASRTLLERALGDRAAAVRLVAIVELQRRGHPPPGLPDLDRTLTEALDASDAMIRRAARRELRAILLSSVPDPSAPDAVWDERIGVLVEHLAQRADRVETAQALRDIARRHGSLAAAAARQGLRHVEDRDIEVRGALLALAGHAGLAQEGPRMVAALGARSGAEAEGGREGLVALGATAVLPLVVGLEFGGPARRDAILTLLRELEVGADTLEELRRGQLEALQRMAALGVSVQGLSGAAARLLRRRLAERLSEGLGAMLCVLAAVREDRQLAELERRLRRAVTSRQRDIVLEAIEAVLSRSERDVLVPLLETGRPASGPGAEATELTAADALAELRGAADATTCRLAAAISLEGADAIGDPGSVPRAMDIAVALQEVPAFGRLSTPQLLQLAELLQEQKLASGERIYAEGDEGLSLYFLLEGEVELRREELVLERVSAGSVFGELSILDGLPRSADAVAVEPARVLRLERDDLLPLLDETPGLAMGLAQLLSTRVRRLEERLHHRAPAPGGDA